MRKCKNLFQSFLVSRVKSFRAEKGLSQEEMAEMLRIAPRSYFDLEHENCAYSATSLMLFLLALTESEVLGFLRDFRSILERNDQDDIA